MEKLKRILKRIFCLSPLPTVSIAFAGYALILIVAIFDIEIPAVRYAAYLAAAYALIISITGLVYIKAAAAGMKKYVCRHPLMEKLRSAMAVKRFLADIRFRTGVLLYMGVFINLLYIAMKLFSGIYYRSPWFLALAAYYILLAVLRLMLIGRVHVRDKALELRRYRLCGILLLLMNQALVGIVVFMVHQDKGFDYPGFLVYGMALYAFYAVITAAVSVAKARHHDSPILSAAKGVDLVAALVSILSLETAMVARFGEGDAVFRRTMTGITGGGVCIIVIGMAVFMILRANRQLRKLKTNYS